MKRRLFLQALLVAGVGVIPNDSEASSASRRRRRERRRREEEERQAREQVGRCMNDEAARDSPECEQIWNEYVASLRQKEIKAEVARNMRGMNHKDWHPFIIDGGPG